jgi:uncharacterized membrane protein YqjE
MKVKDKDIKLYLIKRLEDYNFNMDMGEIEHSKIRLEENKFYLFAFLTLIGLILSLIGRRDIISIFLIAALLFEAIYIIFSQKHIRIANSIIEAYQKRKVPESHIDLLLEQINEEWDVDWKRLKPIVTESMIKEAKLGKMAIF